MEDSFDGVFMVLYTNKDGEESVISLERSPEAAIKKLKTVDLGRVILVHHATEWAKWERP